MLCKIYLFDIVSKTLCKKGSGSTPKNRDIPDLKRCF